MDTIDHDSREPDSKDADRPATLDAGMTIGDFRVEERIGAGGMGVVYRARQISLNRVVALKVLGNALQSEVGIARFRREAQAVAKLKHPGIAGIHFIGQDEQVCYIAMEYVEGVTFREMIRRLRVAARESSSLEDAVWRTAPAAATASLLRFDLPTTDGQPETERAKETAAVSANVCELIARQDYVRHCVDLTRDVALALAHAHEQGVVHRDMKPENLLFDQAGKVTVIDFGLARFYEDQTITHTGQLVGTPLYMSPEQVVGLREIDARTDIYSLGMVLHELLTLEPPLDAPNRESLFRQIVTRALPPINWQNPAVSEDLAAIVHHTLAKDPDERYATMREFAADFDRFLAGKPVTAPPYRFRLDEREIFAQRPNAVIYLAFLCFFIGLCFGFWAFGELALVWPPGVYEAAFAFILLVNFLTLARAILVGHSWGRWYGLALGALFIAGAIYMSIEKTTRVPDFTRMALVAVGGFSGVMFVGVLGRPRVARWFRFAAEARAAFGRERNKTTT